MRLGDGGDVATEGGGDREPAPCYYCCNLLLLPFGAG